MQKQCYLLLLALGMAFSLHAQQATMKTLPLDDLSAFRPQAGNWSIVGDVMMDPNQDIHPKAPQPTDAKTKKRKKSKAAAVEPALPQAVTFTEGKGILLNMNDDVKKDHLVTVLEHGDIELELEVMLPKGSNSGIYLQGRYEVQLLDSWGVKNPKYGDIGGIYRNWETNPAKIYRGKAPLTNAAKAPGLWQKMKIAFRAPKFDANGNKTANARFVSIELNGVKIHDNIEVPLPTGGPLENNETPMGPLMIQGDHGPVAFRNIRYKLMKEVDFKISNIQYEIYHGRFKSTDDLASLKPVASGKSEVLTSEVVDVENAYGIRYKGEITVPEDARYRLQLNYSGGGRLSINNKELFNFATPDRWRSDTASIMLKAGTYPFEFVNFKDASWMPPRLALYIGAAHIYPEALHSINSYPPSDDPVSSIYVNPGKEPRLLRAFIDFNGKRSERLTHTIGVGDPVGVNYVYDTRSGNLVCVWRGDFVNATPMWHERGDGSFRPMGAVMYLFNNQPLAYLPGQQEPFPAVAQEGDLRGKGYVIEEATNRPVFLYSYQGLTVEDRVYPDETNNSLLHEVTIKEGNRKEGLHYKLAEGSAIQQMADGTYVVDKNYYIKVKTGGQPFIREVNGKKELVTPFTQQSLTYLIIW